MSLARSRPPRRRPELPNDRPTGRLHPPVRTFGVAEEQSRNPPWGRLHDATGYMPDHRIGRDAHFLLLPPDAVILLVLIRSPMYFWRNLLLLSNLSCSSLTASIRWNMVRSESCKALACLPRVSMRCHGPGQFCTNFWSSLRASWPMTSRSSLVLRGLIALTSSGSILVSTGPTAAESRGTIMVPLLFLLGSRGRLGMGARMGFGRRWSSE
jgi:hypothetical protein